MMTEPMDPAAPPPYGAVPPPPPPPPYAAAPGYGAGPGYGPPPGQRINDAAPMGLRLLARIIDGVLTGAVSIALTYALGMHVFSTTTTSDGSHEASFSLYNGDYFKYILITLIVTGLYEVSMLVNRGATLGKMAVGVRVAMMDNGEKPTTQAALTRWGIPAVAGAVFPLLQLIVVVSVFFDSTHRNRGWYDYAAKTIAVRTK
jgi:uncharacterized RDD family membrane protein YckC